MINKALIFFLVFTTLGCKEEKIKAESNFKIGIVSDCQYCNCDMKSNRYYKNSTFKFNNAINEFNNHDLDYTIHLGDFIDRDFNSFDSVLPIWNTLKSEHYHVLGNHDFSVEDILKESVPEKMGMKSRYYSIKRNNWRFIVLDGNDLSFFGTTSNKKKQETDSLYNLLKSNGYKNIQTWNGGLSLEQLKWVQDELNSSVVENEKVGFYCHFPVDEKDTTHSLWNYDQFLKLIDHYSNVKFYFNGHNHAGGYFARNGVHFLTFKGMVDYADSTAYSVATISKDTIFIKGYGREKSINLEL